MPMNEKYDVFLSMANLLNRMGFHQKAELLLYEAMSYSQEPYEAHMQLGLIFLDKEKMPQRVTSFFLTFIDAITEHLNLV